jgi:protoheme IX farnesyltransferase
MSTVDVSAVNAAESCANSGRASDRFVGHAADVPPFSENSDALETCSTLSAQFHGMDWPLRTALVTRLADYLELTKPRIAVMALVTVAVGYTLGCAGNWELVPLLHALCGVALVASGSSALNHYLERSVDRLMDRTQLRPLPAGRLSPAEVLLFGLVLGAFGVVYLATCVNLLTAVLAALTLVLYVAIYTPLKQSSSLCTTVGAIPGALPPVLGWTAAGGPLDRGAFALFAILFVWQFPHFLAIAWLYRDDYARAGLRMLPTAGRSTHAVALMAVLYALALLPVSLLPQQFGLAGHGYALAALVLGAGYASCAVRFLLGRSTDAARGLLVSSLIYLPVLLLALTWDHLQLLR